MNKIKICSIVGARPQFVKAAVISREIKKYNSRKINPKIKELIIHTGQHYDNNMSQVFFDQLKMGSPDYNLSVGSYAQGKQTGMMIEKIEKVLLKEKPDWIIVYGDTNSTLAGALAAAKLHIPVAHIEAGLRSFNKRMPEEINRILTDHVSNLLFCPTETAVKNLNREGIKKGVYNVGDVMYDSILYYFTIAEKKSKILKDLKLKPKNYYLTTIHRAENTNDIIRFKNILLVLDKLDLQVIFPVHPRARKIIKDLNIELSNIKTITPVSYLDMLVIEKNAKIILTDSGGVQKEAYFLKTPCVTLRDETEWIETIKSGKNILTVANELKIKKAVKKLTSQNLSSYPSFFGDGKTARKIVKSLVSNL